MFQLCWSAGREEASIWLWGAVSTRDRSLFSEGQTSVVLLHRVHILCNQVNHYMLISSLYFSLFSGSGAVLGHLLHAGPSTGQKRWRTFGFLPQLPEVLPHSVVRFCMWVIPLFPKVLTHSTAGQCVQNSCIHMGSIALNEINWKNAQFFFSPPQPSWLWVDADTGNK